MGKLHACSQFFRSNQVIEFILQLLERVSACTVLGQGFFLQEASPVLHEFDHLKIDSRAFFLTVFLEPALNEDSVYLEANHLHEHYLVHLGAAFVSKFQQFFTVSELVFEAYFYGSAQHEGKNFLE